MKIILNSPYKYGRCSSCKNLAYLKHGWLLWCNKRDIPIGTVDKCYLYKLKRKHLKGALYEKNNRT